MKLIDQIKKEQTALVLLDRMASEFPGDWQWVEHFLLTDHEPPVIELEPSIRDEVSLIHEAFGSVGWRVGKNADGDYFREIEVMGVRVVVILKSELFDVEKLLKSLWGAKEAYDS